MPRSLYQQPSSLSPAMPDSPFTSSTHSHSAVYAMENWLDIIFGQSHTLAVIVDMDGNCSYLSPNCTDITGYAIDSLQGSNLDELVHMDDLANLPFAEMTEALGLSAGSGAAAPAPSPSIRHQTELRLRHSDKKWHWHRVEMQPTHGLSLTGSFLLLCQDVTRDKLLEHRLERARIAADIARSSRTQFLSHMHHELRTPLNAIIGFAEMMRAELFGPIGNQRYLQYLEHIRESGNELLNVINNTLELASLTSGEVELHPQRIDARILMRQAAGKCQEYAAQHHITLQQHMPAMPLWVDADTDKIRQSLQHILHNAIKFSAPYSCVTIDASRNKEGQCAIRIIDRGEGMSERKMRAVMQPFNVEDVNVTNKVHGAGLGLTLAREFVSLHEGTVTLESTLGQGTTVTIALPLSAAANDDAPVSTLTREDEHA